MREHDFRDLRAKAVEQMFQVGKCYGTGDGVGKDEAEAVKWYRMAAERGSSDAMFELVRCYTFGIGVRRNRATTAKWLQKAAEHDHVRAMFILGNWYLSKQRGVEYNPRKAAWWFRRAADKGDAWGDVSSWGVLRKRHRDKKRSRRGVFMVLPCRACRPR